MTGGGNWTFLLKGRRPVLIDAGVGNAAHLEALEKELPAGPVEVLVTHWHSDHASGVPALATRWPNTEFAKYPLPDRDKNLGVRWNSLADGQRIVAGDRELQAIHTPGHAADHLCFWDESSRVLFAGDLVVQGSTVVILASAGGSLSDYLNSLEKVLALNPARLLPAHGEPIEDPARIIHHYLSHRRQREQQIVAALQDKLGTIEAIVERIYIDLNPALISMARESVLAHLQKLEHDGLVQRSGNEWRMLE
jgi:glyoxylase-like metal-dependent hydrolase (beta-lactamase superfamily II)